MRYNWIKEAFKDYIHISCEEIFAVITDWMEDGFGVAIILLNDGRYASISAYKDQNVWINHSYYISDSLNDVIVKGLTKKERFWLGVEGKK